MRPSSSDTTQGVDSAPSSSTLKRRSIGPLLWLIVLLVLVGGAIWWFGATRETAPAPTATVPAAADASPPAKAAQTNGQSQAPTASSRTHPVIADRDARMAEGMPQPDYPGEALRAGEGGTVLLNVEVDAHGEPSQISIAKRSGNRQLDRAAMTAASKWQFEPAIRDGEAVTATVQIPVEFSPQ